MEQFLFDRIFVSLKSNLFVNAVSLSLNTSHYEYFILFLAFASELKHWYKWVCSHIMPIPWSSDVLLPLDGVFVNLQLQRKE
jgi:hypothetical protein